MRQDEEADGLRDRLPMPMAAGIGRSKGIGQQARKRIGTHLRALYDTVLQQPVPDRFTDLIARLDDDPSDIVRDEALDRTVRDPV